MTELRIPVIDPLEADVDELRALERRLERALNLIRATRNALEQDDARHARRQLPPAGGTGNGDQGDGRRLYPVPAPGDNGDGAAAPAAAESSPTDTPPAPPPSSPPAAPAPPRRTGSRRRVRPLAQAIRDAGATELTIKDLAARLDVSDAAVRKRIRLGEPDVSFEPGTGNTPGMVRLEHVPPDPAAQAAGAKADDELEDRIARGEQPNPDEVLDAAAAAERVREQDGRDDAERRQGASLDAALSADEAAAAAEQALPPAPPASPRAPLRDEQPPTVSKEGTVQGRILQSLSWEAKTITELARALDVPRRDVAIAVRKLDDDDELLRAGLRGGEPVFAPVSPVGA